jgi:signal transduction histidine kinase
MKNYNKANRTCKRLLTTLQPIGLAIVHKGIERMGGQVGIESDLKKGSRFWIKLKRYITAESQ